jgi:hypothetical protein
MTARHRPGRPVEIVLTEEDLAAIIEETARPARASASSVSASSGGASSRGTLPDYGTGSEDGTGEGASGSSTGFPSRGSLEEPFAPIADILRHRGIPRPAAVGDAIRRILEATTLDPGRPTEEE